jgi:hypothetical protein
MLRLVVVACVLTVCSPDVHGADPRLRDKQTHEQVTRNIKEEVNTRLTTAKGFEFVTIRYLGTRVCVGTGNDEPRHTYVVKVLVKGAAKKFFECAVLLDDDLSVLGSLPYPNDDLVPEGQAAGRKKQELADKKAHAAVEADIKKYMLENANDPDSVEFLKIGYLGRYIWGRGDGAKRQTFLVKLRSKNAFGAKQLATWAVMLDDAGSPLVAIPYPDKDLVDAEHMDPFTQQFLERAGRAR